MAVETITPDQLSQLEYLVGFFEEMSPFIENMKSAMKPIFDTVWEHYRANYLNTNEQAAHNLMLGMSMCYDAGQSWNLYQAPNALKYVKQYMMRNDGLA